ncbi:hypothetical protein QLQ12_29295 [Actinoplanes sp. NEAU-A12]|uniref:Transposase n=1 Tax=Actinoplanes sandaracinus TaxID=3045177 RepID=A0ABT6WSK2_9ACTN|nr:hypothetical protein [Actinoplanes sandaracinus]MDI6102722.1 hypothetical protein [Actinoplanes sandaracinus]
MQDLIGRAGWNDALVRADVHDFVARRLGHPDAILVIDETDKRALRDKVWFYKLDPGSLGIPTAR